ncbi:hypothetical protein [Nocardia rhizosphaerae]|uniref:Uncharacterized protein n=1 Tax=Nocardia rhizosphaerae TaxID=1691571 RepID=A0ABV8L0T2_9NOCA
MTVGTWHRRQAALILAGVLLVVARGSRWQLAALVGYRALRRELSGRAGGPVGQPGRRPWWLTSGTGRRIPLRKLPLPAWQLDAWHFARSSGSRRTVARQLAGSDARRATIIGLSGTEPAGRLGTGITWPRIHRLTWRPLTGGAVLAAGHPTFPRRDGRVALCRSLAIFVVVPMSGIIVAHHASCTRRNPRCPPVR